MFSYTHPPGASVAWPPRDERQGWHLPPTRGRPGMGRTRLTKTTEIGTVIRPRRSVTRPARADGSPRAQRRGVRPRRTCGGVPAGSAPMPVARCAPRARRHEGSPGPTGGANHRRRRKSHRWRRDHQRDQRCAAATTGTRGAPGGAESLWFEMWGNAIESSQMVSSAFSAGDHANVLDYNGASVGRTATQCNLLIPWPLFPSGAPGAQRPPHPRRQADRTPIGACDVR